MAGALSRLGMEAGSSRGSGQRLATRVRQEDDGLVILERVWGDTVRKVEGCVSDTICPVPWEDGSPAHQRDWRQLGMDRRQGIRRLAYSALWRQWGHVPQPIRDALLDWCVAREQGVLSEEHSQEFEAGRA